MGDSLYGVVILDRKGQITEKNSDVLARHEAYGGLLKESSENFRLQVLSYSNSNTEVIYESEKIQVTNCFGNRFGLFRVIHSWNSGGNPPALLIAGEPARNFYWAICLKIMYGLVSATWVPIQLQIHFDPKQFRSSKSISKRIYYLVTLISVLLCSSIRLVNQRQLDSIPSFLHRKKQITVAAISIPAEQAIHFKQHSANRPKTIGILGRLHSERGLENIIEFISLIPKSEFDKVIVAGDGPLRDQFLSELEKEIGLSKLVYLGNLNHPEKEIFWEKVGVLLSLPDFESYGLSMLEALMHGIPVIASKTIGSMNLSSKAPEGWLQIINLPTSSYVLGSVLVNAYTKVTNEKFYRLSLEDQIKQCQTLIESWILTSKIS